MWIVSLLSSLQNAHLSSHSRVSPAICLSHTHTHTLYICPSSAQQSNRAHQIATVNHTQRNTSAARPAFKCFSCNRNTSSCRVARTPHRRRRGPAIASRSRRWALRAARSAAACRCPIAARPRTVWRSSWAMHRLPVSFASSV